MIKQELYEEFPKSKTWYGKVRGNTNWHKNAEGQTGISRTTSWDIETTGS